MCKVPHRRLADGLSSMRWLSRTAAWPGDTFAHAHAALKTRSVPMGAGTAPGAPPVGVDVA